MIEQLWQSATQIKNSTLPHETKLYLLGFMYHVAGDNDAILRLHKLYSPNNAWPAPNTQKAPTA